MYGQVDIHPAEYAAQLKTMDNITSQCSFVIQEQIVLFPRTLIKMNKTDGVWAAGQSCPCHCQTGHQSDKGDHIRHTVPSMHC